MFYRYAWLPVIRCILCVFVCVCACVCISSEKEKVNQKRKKSILIYRCKIRIVYNYGNFNGILKSKTLLNKQELFCKLSFAETQLSCLKKQRWVKIRTPDHFPMYKRKYSNCSFNGKFWLIELWLPQINLFYICFRYWH